LDTGRDQNPRNERPEIPAENALFSVVLETRGLQGLGGGGCRHLRTGLPNKNGPPGPGTQNIQKSAGKFFVLIFLSRILIDQAIDIASLFLQIPGGQRT
jgi:hypothetical protein